MSGVKVAHVYRIHQECCLNFSTFVFHLSSKTVRDTAVVFNLTAKILCFCFALDKADPPVVQGEPGRKASGGSAGNDGPSAGSGRETGTVLSHWDCSLHFWILCLPRSQQ